MNIIIKELSVIFLDIHKMILDSDNSTGPRNFIYYDLQMINIQKYANVIRVRIYYNIFAYIIIYDNVSSRFIYFF